MFSLIHLSDKCILSLLLNTTQKYTIYHNQILHRYYNAYSIHYKFALQQTNIQNYPILHKSILHQHNTLATFCPDFHINTTLILHQYCINTASIPHQYYLIAPQHYKTVLSMPPQYYMSIFCSKFELEYYQCYQSSILQKFKTSHYYQYYHYYGNLQMGPAPGR